MKTILPPIRAAASILGEQKIRENTVYRENRHRFDVPCPEGTLWMHTLTGELILLEPGETVESCREELIRRWFLLPPGYDEDRQADGVRRVATLLKRGDGRRTSFTVLTTTDCNARCFYCYEMGLPRYAMTPGTARDVGEYIARVSGGRKVSLSWFGGEPLYNPGVIDIICGILREKGVEYTSILTSNGYYLDAETAQKAVRDWHVTTAQITVDGTEAVYNRTKAFIDRDEGSPFQRVMSNIGAALDTGMEICVRLNMDRANAEDLLALTDEIARRFGPRPNLTGRAALLGKFVGDIHAFSSWEEASAWQVRLERKLEGCGMMRHGEMQRRLCVNQCMADNDACEVILPDGRIERCEHIRENEAVGTIYDEARDGDLVRSWKETVCFPECRTCPFYPACVNLKKCEWNRNGCSESRRNYNRRELTLAILGAYERWKASGESGDEPEAELFAGGSRW